jgi:hypothetical protein
VKADGLEVATISGTQTLTNKTLTSSTNVLGGVTVTMGSDATGDIYYRNSGGVLTRLAVGSAGQLLNVSGGLPAWIAPASVAIADPPSQSIQFNNGSNLLEGDAAFLFDVATATVTIGQSSSITGKLLLRNSTNGNTLTLTPATGATGTLTLPAVTDTVAVLGTAQTFTAAQIISSNAAAAFVVGPNGDTNPALRVVANVASAATGLSITGNAAGSGVTLTALSSGTNENITITPKGTGSIKVPLGTVTAPSLLFDVGSAVGFWSDGSAIIYTNSTGSRVTMAYNRITIRSDASYTVSSSANSQGTPDTSWVRAAAATWRATNASDLSPGSDGAGNLIIGTAAGAIGTSGAGVLAFALSTAPTTSPADVGGQFYSLDWNGAGTAAVHLRNEESGIYIFGSQFKIPTVVFSSLGTPANGTLTVCTDCTVTSGSDNTCAGSGSGALAVRLNGVWRCFNAQN